MPTSPTLRLSWRGTAGAVSIALAALLSSPRQSVAQLADTKVLTVAAVKNMLTAAEAMAKQNNWNMSIAITDANGDLIAFLRLDNASLGSVQISQGKARTAARFGRSTKVYADRVLTDTLTFLSVDGLVALQGGLPIMAGGRVIGAIGVSGATSAQDEQVAAAAIATIKP